MHEVKFISKKLLQGKHRLIPTRHRCSPAELLSGNQPLQPLTEGFRDKFKHGRDPEVLLSPEWSCQDKEQEQEEEEQEEEEEEEVAGCEELLAEVCDHTSDQTEKCQELPPNVWIDPEEERARSSNPGPLTSKRTRQLGSSTFRGGGCCEKPLDSLRRQVNKDRRTPPPNPPLSRGPAASVKQRDTRGRYISSAQSRSHFHDKIKSVVKQSESISVCTLSICHCCSERFCRAVTASHSSERNVCAAAPPPTPPVYLNRAGCVSAVTVFILFFILVFILGFIRPVVSLLKLAAN
ncbi:unnamed protein product [Pleuronectes platessa]|uniref:Uncharacterized protein n=1 Tax=Pleuronectes platessa TaxID=8262 RepID=A0A9N7ULG1_PLEPL|nr:unnamed protein product [Pleuronectes platessa]